MTNEQEKIFASVLMDTAQKMAKSSNEIPEDRSAATTAVLVQALILATPEMTDYTRATLFN